MKSIHLVHTILAAGLLASAPLALAEEFSNTPKHETLAQAIQFEKYKLAASEAQARKDAGEAAQTSPVAHNKTARAKRMARKTGQADRSKK